MKNLLKFLVMLICCQKGEVEFMGGGGDGGGDGDGGTGDGNSGVPDDSGDANGGGGDGGSLGEINYHSDLGEELHGNKTLLKYYDKEKKEFSLGATQKALIHATSMIGADQVQIPGKNATDEQRRSFQYKSGLPEKYEDYGLKNNLPEGMTENKEFFDGLTKKAHDIGILPKHAQALFDHYNSAIGEQTNISNEAYRDSIRADRVKMEAEYGEKFKQKMAGAHHAMSEFASEEEMETLKKAGFTDNPLVAKIFIKINEAMNSEDVFETDLIKKETSTPEEMEVEVAEFFKEGSAYMNPQHPEHAAAMVRFERLMVRKAKMRGDSNSIAI